MLKIPMKPFHAFITFVSSLFLLGLASPVSAQSDVEITACESLQGLRSLTIIQAGIRENQQHASSYCYVRGIISPAIHFHAQLPLPQNWRAEILYVVNDIKSI